MDYNAASPMGNTPQLGTPIPGTTGGLPMQSGLNVAQNPMAQQLQSQGRGEDSMLVHMTPDEVNSLQGLAMAHGGSLTINPETGLPEAGFLKKLLPTILGAGLMLIPGVNAVAAAGIVGAGSVLKTGSLKKGLLAGLSAYGGASLAGGLGAGNVFGSAAKEAAKKAAVGNFINSPEFAQQLATKFGGQVASTAGTTAATTAADLARQVANANIPGAVTTAGTTAATTTADLARQVASANIPGAVTTAGTTTAKTGLAGLAQNFGNAARAGLPAGTPAFLSKAAPMIAASGLMQGVSNAMTPSGRGNMGSDGVIDNSYAGPYTEQIRGATYRGQSPITSGDSSEHLYFANSMPEIYNTSGQIVQPGSSTARGTPILQNILNPNAKKGQNRYTQTLIPYMGGPAQNEEDMGYADGGEVELSDGAFVLDARTVSEIGNGSSNAGLEAIRRIGGRPVEGPGDGVSDSVRARIGRDQPARVARDEAIIPADAVKRIGKGSAKRGADKLYSLMNKAHKARKKAKRGQDTKLRHGLG